MYFVIRKNGAGKYWWRAVGDNNETVAHSEILESKLAAEQAIAMVKREALVGNVLDMTSTSDGTYERPR